ncbi:hypothetical protein CDAR_233501 [Caerostris darwini]|uniref:Uncharacterized protein n=1 Tax=Caerostris darwini TaxID=1538125 RepID=A0AAV4NBT5_9ARAC|nr:hypothetical protein CDAR_233501 [Caerostris darwini]
MITLLIGQQNKMSAVNHPLFNEYSRSSTVLFPSKREEPISELVCVWWSSPSTIPRGVVFHVTAVPNDEACARIPPRGKSSTRDIFRRTISSLEALFGII